MEFSGQIIVELPIVCIEYATKKKQDEIPLFDRNFWPGIDIAKFLQNLCTRLFFVDLKVLRIAKKKNFKLMNALNTVFIHALIFCSQNFKTSVVFAHLERNPRKKETEHHIFT